jgi:hypothetical protein
MTHNTDLTRYDKTSLDGTTGTYTKAMRLRDRLREFTRLERKRAAALTPAERRARTRTMAIFCHMGVLFGIPLFVLPLVERTDPVQMHHARAAALTFVAFHAAMILAIGSSPLWLGGILLCYLPALAGVWAASRDRPVGWLGLGPPADLLLGVITPRQLPRDPDDDIDPLSLLYEEDEAPTPRLLEDTR